MTASD